MAEPRVQAFFGVMLDLTGFPGVPGRDENVSEVCARYDNVVVLGRTEHLPLRRRH